MTSLAVKSNKQNNIWKQHKKPETHYNWQMMTNKDGWNSSIYMTDVSNCLFFLNRKSHNKTNQEKPIIIVKKGRKTT